MSTSELPTDLHPAYEWTLVAGELDELARLTGADLERYCAESGANAREHDQCDVHASDLDSLATWLRANGYPESVARTGKVGPGLFMRELPDGTVEMAVAGGWTTAPADLIQRVSWD